MSTIESLQSLHEVLEPLGVSRNETDDLGDWIHDSFSALEKLHEELTQWQSELARKETELNLRTDALEKSPRDKSEVQQQLEKLEGELAAAQEDTRLLEKEKAQQLVDYENLVNKYAQLKSDLHDAHEQIAQLVDTIESQRHRAEKDRELWLSEFRELHAALKEHNTNLLAKVDQLICYQQESKKTEPDSSQTVPSSVKPNQLRQRAKLRRKPKN